MSAVELHDAPPAEVTPSGIRFGPESGKYREIADVLRANPGKWAKVAKRRGSSGAGSHYPYEFHCADALDYLDRAALSGFDAIHASPPCQAFTRAAHLRTAQGGVSKYPDLLTPILDLFRSVTIPWVVENVPGAPGMDGAAVECGSAYGLGVRRHRLFLSNVPLVGSGCDHKAQGRPWGVYHVPSDNIPQGGRTARDAEHGREVMGVDRPLPWASLKEGFPPAFSEHIGRQLIHALGAVPCP